MGRFAGNSGALALHFLVLAGQFDGTEGNLRPSNALHGVREVHAPHAWVRVRRTHPSQIPEDILLDRVQGTK